MASRKPFGRTVTDMGNGCIGVSIPKGAAEQLDIEQGDELAVDRDLDAGTITYRVGKSGQSDDSAE